MSNTLKLFQVLLFIAENKSIDHMIGLVELLAKYNCHARTMISEIVLLHHYVYSSALPCYYTPITMYNTLQQ